MVRTRESERSAILDQAMLTDLPAGGGRDFMSLLKATGEVVQSGGDISLAGQGRRTANFIADGVSMTGREIRTLDGAFGGGSGLSLETIKELQVITSGFKAETGQTGAGTISVVTKSGTNRYEGTVFGYFRPTSLVGDNPITGNPPAKQDRQQWGGVLGGPIARDKTHFFGAWESTRVNGESVVTSVLDPGTFPTKSHINQGFGRIDHRFNANNVLDARYSLTRNGSENGGIGGLNTFDRRSNNESESDTVVSSLVTLFGSNKVNEARVRYTYNTTDSYSPLTADSGVASRTPDFSNVPVSVSRAGVGNTGPPTGPAAEPRGEAAAVRQQLLDSRRLASVEVRRRRHPFVALRHVLQQLRRHLHVRRRARRSRSTPPTRRPIPSSTRRASAPRG